jgi:hypothetical protein
VVEWYYVTYSGTEDVTLVYDLNKRFTHRIGPLVYAALDGWSGSPLFVVPMQYNGPGAISRNEYTNSGNAIVFTIAHGGDPQATTTKSARKTQA